MSIEVNGVLKNYGDQKALDKISFSIPKAEIVGFLGPNGAGKSTLMKILTTYLKQDEGNAIVNGFDTLIDPLEVKKSVGYLPEHNPLYLELFVKEYLQFLAEIHKVPKERVDEVIDLVGLTLESNKKISQLSKGYRQRVGLAAALLHDPDVLILDEPTTGLDPNQLVEIRNLILEIGKTKTVLLSTHVMQEVEAMCDRVIIINKGMVVADKKLKDLLEDQNQVIEVEFDLRVEQQLLQKILNIKTAKNIFDNTWQLTFDTKTDMRSEIFDFANANGLKTLQLQQKSDSLESLFQSLTN